MKIAHVLSSFGIGGQERMAVEVARAQRAAGHRVFAISLASEADGPIRDAFRAAGVSTMSEGKRPGVEPLLSFRLASRLRLDGIDLVHTHNPAALIYGAPAAKLAGAAVVHTKHGVNQDGRRRMWLRRAAGRLVDAFVVVTPTLADVVRRDNDVRPSRLWVVRNGVDTGVFAPDDGARQAARARLGIPQSACVVGTVGRLAVEKDQALLLRAMVPLLGPAQQLVVVGDGPERLALEDIVRATGLGRYIHLLGARADVPALMAAFDVFALPSRTEGLPLVLLEAMSTELVVVASSVGGIPDLVSHGVTGFLTQAGAAESLTRQLSLVCAEPRAFSSIGQAARRRVLTQHSLAHMAADYEIVYARAMMRPALRRLRATAPAS